MTADIKATEEKEKILNYSRNKFHREGFYKTSMDEISSELHISKKTIYKYFSSKEKLLEEICSGTSCDIGNRLDSIVDGKDNVVIKFVRILNFHSNFSRNISDKWLRDLSIHAPDIKKNIDEKKNERINKVVEKLLEQGKKEKLIEDYPSKLIILAFNSSLTSALNSDFLINNNFSMHDAFRITYEMLLNGILTEKGKVQFYKTKTDLDKEIEI
ncbi:MAG: TetR/AcrR family transcriptional regulator [Ignavibacteria bacterium]|nr:TetR/AcrR family transcriptional regulator [Ignavibacteria bacterium]MBK7447116.1 TetR/AcrR family transcriptional regulator [Ignavibacteria bacterium]MBK8380822.1 TetR/AcrR family transcriptional regulator [Ignavibacteria bacterium]MBK9405817.1 TetR/AcrR family transcriptional regulator [Ignavibacteria bacterium]